jgi:hypothetical protein
MHWIWEEIFSMDVPVNWNIKESDEIIEIVPPKPVGAAHISILRRKKSDDVNHEEPLLLLRNSANKQGISIHDKNIVRVSSNMCRARFQTKDKECDLCWIVYVYVWRTRAAVCSYCYNCEEYNLCDQAHKMFASILPEKAALSWVQ